MSITVDTSQLRALAADFGFAASVVGLDVGDAFERGAYAMQGRAQVLAPVDTGALKNSISTDTGSLSFTVGPEVNYGGYVELGTSRMAPEPYLAPAFDATLPGLLDDVADEAIKAIAGR